MPENRRTWNRNLSMNGIIIVNKEKGFTSHDVVAKLRGILRFKKIGHTGTLDPDATGVLPVCVGKATRVCDLLTDKDKTYVAVVKLGVTTDTQDMTGQLLASADVSVTEDQLRVVLKEFTGEIDQIPPMYSAIKVNGKKLYELARQGKEIERKARRVTIHNLFLRETALQNDEFTIEVTCSKGTYIRSLCHDIGQRLGCGAAMQSLVRTRVGEFCLAEARTLSEIERLVRKSPSNGEDLLMPVDSVFKKYARCDVSGKAMKFLQNGNLVASGLCRYTPPAAGEQSDSVPERVLTASDGETVRMYGADGEFYALYRYDDGDNMYHNVKMFHDEG